MKNITLAINEEVLAKVRRLAAEKDTTVNGIVREYLTRLADIEDKAKAARQRLVELSRQSTWELGPDWKWNREELYDRPSLRRHEHSDLRGVESASRSAQKDKGE